MTPTLFESLPQRFSNIDKLSFNYNRTNTRIFFYCGHQIENYKFFQCIVRVFESTAELNRIASHSLQMPNIESISK